MTRKSVKIAPERKRTRFSPAARRQQFIELGLESLKTQPLEQVSIEDIATAAGVSAGLLFHYFDSKLDFQVALVEEQARIVGEIVIPDREIGHLSEVLPVVSDTLRVYVDHIVENRQSLLPMLAGVSWSEPRIREAVKRVRQQIVNHFMLQAEILGIEATPRYELTAHGFIALVEETLVQWIDENGGFAEMSRDDVVEHLAAMLLAMAGTVGLDLTQ